jgi:hypothetical protein
MAYKLAILERLGAPIGGLMLSCFHDGTQLPIGPFGLHPRYLSREIRRRVPTEHIWNFCHPSSGAEKCERQQLSL